MAEKTFWNGEPCRAVKVRVIVGPSMRPTWWCAGMVGQERAAVRVDYGRERFYLDNEDGSGWAKVTTGRGSPNVGHSSLPVASEVSEKGTHDGS
jgi:hypothetical protein